MNEDRSWSQELPTDLTLTKLEMGNKRADAERKNSQDREMKTKISRSTSNGSRFFKRFRKKKTTNIWRWKACEVVVLALATVVTMSINAVPTIIYFTLEVSEHLYIHTTYYVQKLMYVMNIFIKP